MWQRFTERARKVVFYSQEEAGKLGENYVSTEHLLLGLIRETDSVASRILDRLGIPLARIRAEIEKQVERGDGRLGQDMQLTPRAKRVIDLAYDEARQLNNNYIGTEHLLLGLIREAEGLAGRVLIHIGVTLDQARVEVLRLQAGSNKDEILSFDQAMQLLGVSKATLYRLLNQEEIKGLKAGRQWRFNKSDIFTYLERGKHGTQQVAASKALEELIKALDLKSDVPMSTGDEAANEQNKQVQASRLLLEPAIQAHATAVHFEPQSQGFILRYRISGKLQTMQTLTISPGAVLRHFKQAAGLDPEEMQHPQQGRFVYCASLRPLASLPDSPMENSSVDGIPQARDYEISVATLPTLHGETLTLRLMEKVQQVLTLETLGLESEGLETLRTWLMQSSGLIMVLGPKQSGKTTLLQALAQEIAQPETKTFWIGMPPEGLSAAVMVMTLAGNDAALDRLLQGVRQSDPDYVLVDGLTGSDASWQTIGMAMAHGVVVTITAIDLNNAVAVLPESERELIALAHVLRGVVTTRLVRRLCPDCKVPVEESGSPAMQRLLLQSAEAGYLVPDGTLFYTGRGCDHCGYQGYQGQIGLFEVMPWSRNMTDGLLKSQNGADTLTEDNNGLAADGVRKASAGLTSLDEVLRAVSLPGAGLS